MKILLTLVLFFIGSFNLYAQKTYEDWNDIDKITINEEINIADFKTIYLAPVEADPSIVKFEDDSEDVMKKVTKQMADFRSIIKNTINKDYKTLNIKIIDKVPATLNQGEMMIKMKYTEFNLGSAALRAWSFAGNSGITIDCTISTPSSPNAITFTQRHKSGWKVAYDKVLKEQQIKFAKDFVEIFYELEK